LVSRWLREGELMQEQNPERTLHCVDANWANHSNHINCQSASLPPTSAQGQELCAIGPHKSMMMRMLMMTIYFRPAASKSKPIGARLLV